MTRAARLARIKRLIEAGDGASFRDLLHETEVSDATLKRDLEYLREQLGTPIEYDRFTNTYKVPPSSRTQRYELPGLWLDEREMYSLLVTHRLLGELDGHGAFSQQLQPALARIHQLLKLADDEVNAIAKRVRIVSTGRRPVPPRIYERISEALVTRRRVAMRYFSRGRQATGERVVSPQRLVHHRNTWYLDAWCHRSEALRRFALDAIEEARVADEPAHDVPMADVEAAMDAGYGVYVGAERQWARLAFSRQAATWVSREQWHLEQEGHWQPDGTYELRVPYADPTELAMDILRHAGDVQILDDTGQLTATVRDRLHRAAVALDTTPSSGGGVAPASSASGPAAPPAGGLPEERQAHHPLHRVN